MKITIMYLETDWLGLFDIFRDKQDSYIGGTILDLILLTLVFAVLYYLRRWYAKRQSKVSTGEIRPPKKPPATKEKRKPELFITEQKPKTKEEKLAEELLEILNSDAPGAPKENVKNKITAFLKEKKWDLSSNVLDMEIMMNMKDAHYTFARDKLKDKDYTAWRIEKIKKY